MVVIGAGLMGAGIAQVAAQAGWSVTLRDVTEDTLAKARGTIEGSYRKFAAKGRMTDEDVETSLARISYTTDLAAAGEADLVVEAVFERLDVKRDVFVELDRICRPDAVLATNTSAIPITQIAAATSRPENVVGTHFFSPVPLMRLCELVRGFKTSDEALAAAREFAESVGKTCVVVNRDVAGFVTTRLITALSVEAARLVESGVATAEDVDRACQLGFGHAMGPMRTMDLTGVDVLRNAALNIYSETQEAKFLPPEIISRMVTAGELGRKSGAGWYEYPPRG